MFIVGMHGMQCCGSGSGRIQTFFPDPEISPPNPDPDPALVVLKKKYLFLCNIVHMYIYLLRRCDSSIGQEKLHGITNLPMMKLVSVQFSESFVIACTSITRSTYFTFGTTRYILLRLIRIRSVLRGRILIRIRSKSVRIRNTDGIDAQRGRA